MSNWSRRIERADDAGRVNIMLRRIARNKLADELADGFTVASYNVGNGLADPERLAGYLGSEQADIVGLQELSVSQAAAIKRRLPDIYPYMLLVPAGFTGKGLLSKLPFLESGSVSFIPDRPDLNATVEVFNRRLRVIVAHPRPPKVRLAGVMFDPVTEGQIQMVAQMAVEESPSVILGDFNMTARQAQHAHLTRSGLIDAFQAMGNRAASFPKRIGHTHRVGPRVDKVPLRPIIRIDYVWYTPELAASRVWVGKDAGSDHLPVLARLNWREEAQD